MSKLVSHNFVGGATARSAGCVRAICMRNVCCAGGVERGKRVFHLWPLLLGPLSAPSPVGTVAAQNPFWGFDHLNSG